MEALNNIAGADRQVIIVVNDNERSYSQTIGGLAQSSGDAAHHGGLREVPGLGSAGAFEARRWWVGRRSRALHGVKKGISDVVAPQGMFEDLGLNTSGPWTGMMWSRWRRRCEQRGRSTARSSCMPITEKGRGYAPAEADEADRFHGVGRSTPTPACHWPPPARPGPACFTSQLLELAREREDIVAITAAMPGPTGLTEVRREFGDRFYDVGIAEQHAATSAAGMALGGLHPVVALYATFLNRAFDQVLMDCALHRRRRDVRAGPGGHHRRRRGEP